MDADLLGERAAYDNASFPEPREFQVRAHEALRQGAREGHKRQMLMAATGSGKTFLALRACHEALKKGKRAIFLCDRIALVNQTSDVADSYGLGEHGIIQAGHWRYQPSMPLQVASAQTLARRVWPESDVLIIDEAHTQMKVWTDYLATYEGHVLALSATPFSKGLGKMFTNLINAATMAELVELGVLVPMRVLSCTKANMKGAETSGGEWTDRAAAERGLAIVGDVVSEWQKFADGRKTICFGATIAHCEELCRQFNEAGIMAAVYCSTTTDSERTALLKEYRKPDSTIRVLISVSALSKGFDVPDVGCICDCRPLRKSLSEFIQMVGRGARSSPSTGKENFVLLDFSGNIVRFIEDFTDVYYNGLKELDAGEALDKTIRKDEEEGTTPSCPKCGFSPFGKRCLSCGYTKQKAALIEHEASNGVREIMIGKLKAADSRWDLFAQCATYARSRGNPDTAKGRAAHLYRDITGIFPPRDWVFEAAPNKEVSKAVLNKIRQKQIAWRAMNGKRAA